ncbi:MAG: hypothetical protein ACXVAX_00835 [Pseudobdellovibrio sp.]
MKKLLLTVSFLFISFNAFAADEMNDVIKCGRLQVVPDLGLQVTLSQGGIAGITLLKVDNFFLGHSTSNSYMVAQEAVQPGVMGAPVTYKGDEASLSVNFTTAPLKDGGHIGSLTLYKDGQVTSTEQLSCKSVAQPKPAYHALALVSGVDMNIRSVELESNGSLKVTSTKGQVKNVVLSDKNVSTLNYEAQTLDNVELATDKRVVICMMMVNPMFIQNFSVYNTATDSMRVMLAGNSCASPEKTYPAEANMNSMAQNLKSQMLILAQQVKF